MNQKFRLKVRTREESKNKSQTIIVNNKTSNIKSLILRVKKVRIQKRNTLMSKPLLNNNNRIKLRKKVERV